mmetsp:Transcript_12252/g.33035  ORF Transcript_12252/g.33035 Transcript_12252/m.33035 type:complete len:179 (+) Transcript_12252:122-658(+)
MEGGSSRCGCFGQWNLAPLVKWGNVGIGSYFVVVGIFSLINIFVSLSGALASPIGFILFLYISVFGLFLVFGELDWPEGFIRLFYFLRGCYLRALFELFIASLALTAGFTGSTSNVTNILLIIGGFIALVLGVLCFCYGTDHNEEDEALGQGTAGGSSSGGGLFSGMKSQTQNPVNAI